MNQMAVQVPVLTFSGKKHSISSLALVFYTNKDIELKNFTDVAIDKRTESKATKSKIKIEVSILEVYRLLTTILNSTVLLMLPLIKAQNQSHKE